MEENRFDVKPANEIILYEEIEAEIKQKFQRY